MRRNLILVVFSILLISCNNKNNVSVSTDHIIFPNALYFVSQDTHCGEWGGKQKIICVFKEYENQEDLYAEYYEHMCNYQNRIPDSIIFRSKTIKLSKNDLKIVNECIDEFFVSYKIEKHSNWNAIPVNKIIIGNSHFYPKLLLQDRNPKKWDNFEELYKIVNQ